MSKSTDKRVTAEVLNVITTLRFFTTHKFVFVGGEIRVSFNLTSHERTNGHPHLFIWLSTKNEIMVKLMRLYGNRCYLHNIPTGL